MSLLKLVDEHAEPCRHRSRLYAFGKANEKQLHQRLLFAVFMNVTKRKQTEETRELLAGEMSFRVKNLFSIAA